MANETIPCPVCGTTMNHHANKIIYGSDEADGTVETLEQLYRCPACGASASQNGTM
jgi:transposase-like protein